MIKGGDSSSSSGYDFGDSGDEAELVEQVCCGYDRLHRLVDFDRGKLIRDDDLIDPLARKAQWTLDATGNWSRFRRFDQWDSAAALDQTREHNGVNEVTDIAETVGRIWVSPTHDRAGNMLLIPRPSDPRESYTATFDAWHRLVKLEQSDGAGGLETVAEYQYDGRNFRTLKRTYTGGVLSETRHFYHSSQWQVLEERLDDSEAAACQYVWGSRYIDDLVLRDRDTVGDGTLDERFYALQDANWNVIAISNPDCQIQERYAYDAYGTLAVHNGAFTPIAATAFAWPYTYTARRLDEETGLMYYRNRIYHPELGRFVSRDPIGYDAGDASLYRYVRNNPIKYVDPSGLRDPVAPFEYVDGAMILRIDGPSDLGESGDMLSSLMDLSGQSLWRHFWSQPGGCWLCSKVGFAQIAKTRLDTPTIAGFGPFLLLLDFWGNRDWHVDGGIPYKGNSIDPRQMIHPGLKTGHTLPFTDEPGLATGSYWWGAEIHHFSQQFETHLICLDGPEAGAIYGGVQWGHSFTFAAHLN